jgi:hypothetical protein
MWRYRHERELEKNERRAGESKTLVGEVRFWDIEHDLRSALDPHLRKLRGRKSAQRIPRVIENIEVGIEVTPTVDERSAQVRRRNDSVHSLGVEDRQTRTRFLDIRGTVVDGRHEMVMEIQHVAQFSARVELPRVTVAESSDRHDDSAQYARPLGDESTAGHWVFVTALLSLGGLYVLQSVSPLRLESDAVDYLSTGAAIADGRTLPNVPFPSGYPVLIGMLDRAGLGSSFYFILANCVLLGVGVWATWRVFNDRPQRVRMWIVVATLLTISVVRSVAAPLPEAAFFGTSLLALAAVTEAVSAPARKRLMLFAAALVAAAIAISIRLVGVALIPTLLWASLSAAHEAQTTGAPKKSPAVASITIVLALAAAVVILSNIPTVSHYLEHPRYWYLYGGLRSPVALRLYSVLSGIGQLAINIPYSRFHSLGPVFAATGLIVVGALAVGRDRGARLQLVDVYLACYLAVLAFWPYDSPRLWMPIAPLIAAHVVSALDRARDNRPVRLLIPAYAAWFALTGLAALAYTTRISLSGPDFARLYGTDGGKATTAIHTVSPEVIRRYNAQADSILTRYGGH